jgi:hypothetical protein
LPPAATESLIQLWYSTGIRKACLSSEPFKLLNLRGNLGSERPLPPFPTRRKSTIFPPIVRLNSEACRTVVSNRGHATTDTDIRFKSRFETSGEFHRDIPPPTPRSEATVCAVTGGNIAELAATAFVAPLIVLLSVRTIGYRGEQCGGGESVSQSPLKEKAFSTFLDQNPPFEGISPSAKACPAQWPIIDNRAIKRLAKGKLPSHRSA